jgi:predicted small lipoprotein YifL
VILIVKSSFALPAGTGLLLPLLLTLSACGQTGPLYMPHTPPKTARHHGNATTPATPATPASTATAIGTATSPPAPAAGVVGPSVDSNANDTQATQPPSTPAIQQ